jgi:hypothetical protein
LLPLELAIASLFLLPRLAISRVVMRKPIDPGAKETTALILKA